MSLRSEIFATVQNGVRCTCLLFLAVTVMNLPPAWGASRGLSAAEKQFLKEIRFVFTQEEWKTLNKLPAPEKMFYAEKILEVRSPECKLRHQEHVALADKLFSTPGYKGSRTDAGRFFIVWSKPQQSYVEELEDSYWEQSREEFIPFKYTRMTWLYTEGMGLKPGEKRTVVFADIHYPGFFELKSDEIVADNSKAESIPAGKPCKLLAEDRDR